MNHSVGISRCQDRAADRSPLGIMDLCGFSEDRALDSPSAVNPKPVRVLQVIQNCVIFLLPALPIAWHVGEVTGLKARGSVEVDLLGDRKGCLCLISTRSLGRVPNTRTRRTKNPEHKHKNSHLMNMLPTGSLAACLMQSVGTK